MNTLPIEPHLFTVLQAGFYVAEPDDTRIKSELLDRVRTALTKASTHCIMQSSGRCDAGLSR
jgi:hypothetical protein